MKKLFFLFAAAALLTACSSDELSETTGGGGTTTNPDTEQIVSSSTVELNNGIEIAVGALDNATATRTAEEATGAVNFVIDLSDIEGIEDVLNGFGDYKLKADDFIVRRDGEYAEDIKPENNKYQYATIEMVEENLKVAVKNLEKLQFEASEDKCEDYTFEFYLWIENKELKNDGSGTYGELFKWADKCNWIGGWPKDNGETGMDLSQYIWNTNAGNSDAFFQDHETMTQCGLLVRYNVYRGLSGRPVNENGEFDKENGLGDTPYIKVSVHVEKKDQTTPNSIKNECTWVSIPYTPNKALSKDSSDIISVK